MLGFSARCFPLLLSLVLGALPAGAATPPIETAQRGLDSFLLQCSYCDAGEVSSIRSWVQDYLSFYRKAGFSFEPSRLEIRIWEPGFSFKHLTSVDGADRNNAVAYAGRKKDFVELKYDLREDDSIFRGILFHEVGHWLQTEELRIRSSESLGLLKGYSEAMREEWMLQSEITLNWLQKGKFYAQKAFLAGDLSEQVYRRLDGEIPVSGTLISLQEKMDSIVLRNRELNAQIAELFPEDLRFGPSAGKSTCMEDYREFTRGPSELMSDLMAVAYTRDLSLFDRVMKALDSATGPERDFRHQPIQEPRSFLARFYRAKTPILSSHRALTPLRGDIGEALTRKGFDPKWVRGVFLTIQNELSLMRNESFCGFDSSSYLDFWSRLRSRLIP